LSATLLDSARDMLSADGRSWEVAGDADPAAAQRAMFVASIGLSGPGALRGSLVLIAAPEFFGSVYPPEIATRQLSNEKVADWASELANQLLGRIKNRLSSRGLDFSLSIPTVVRGDLMRPPDQERPNALEHAVLIGGQRLVLVLEIERPGRPLFSPNSPPTAASAEGDGILF
jgi:chemotaxis protein CheX